MAADAGYIAGAFHAWVATRDSNGYPKGTDSTPNTVSNNTTLNAYKLPGLVEASVPAPTREIVTFRGGLAILGQRAMGVSDFGTFDMTLAGLDETFHALVSGATHDATTHSALNISSPNVVNAALPQLILGLVYGIQLDDGTNQYLTCIFPNVQIAPAFPAAGQDSGVNPRSMVYTVTPSTSTRTGWGMLYSATALALQDNKDIVTYVRHTYPMMLCTYTDDNSTGTFTLAYEPMSSDATNATNIVLANGVKTNPTSISTSTGVVVITPGTAADIWTVLYGTQFITP